MAAKRNKSFPSQAWMGAGRVSCGKMSCNRPAFGLAGTPGSFICCRDGKILEGKKTVLKLKPLSKKARKPWCMLNEKICPRCTENHKENKVLQRGLRARF